MSTASHQLFPFQVSGYDDMPADTLAMSACPRVDVWSDGMTMEQRRSDTDPYSGAVAMLVVLAALLAFMAPMIKRILSNWDTDLLGVRRRANAFDEHTASESRTLVIMIVLGCLCEAILLAVAFRHTAVSDGMALGMMCCVTVGYYFFQLAAYSTIGYTFTDKVEMVEWVKGFNLAQGLLGLLLVLPAIAVMYYPEAVDWLVIVAAVLYLSIKVAFLCKGFRIFYNGLSSLVYFILYLCAVEIVPVIIVIGLAQTIDGKM